MRGRMSPFSPIPRRHPIRVVLSSTALQPFMSVRKAAALAMAQLGVAAFFISGIAPAALGVPAFWFVLALDDGGGVCACSRHRELVAADSRRICRPRANRARRACRCRRESAPRSWSALLLGVLASVMIGHYVAGVLATAIGGWRLTGYVRPEDLATPVALTVIGILWLRIRIGRGLARERMASAVWIAVAILLTTVLLGPGHRDPRGVRSVTAGRARDAGDPFSGWRPADTALAYLIGFALTLPIVGSGDVLPRAAHELPPPRVQALRRTALVNVLFMLTSDRSERSWCRCSFLPTNNPLWTNAPLGGSRATSDGAVGGPGADGDRRRLCGGPDAAFRRPMPPLPTPSRCCIASRPTARCPQAWPHCTLGSERRHALSTSPLAPWPS